MRWAIMNIITDIINFGNSCSPREGGYFFLQKRGFYIPIP